MFMAKQHAIGPLSPTELLNGLAGRAELAGLGTTVDAKPGRTLSTAGMTAPQFVVVIRGELMVEVAGAASARLSAGEWFGHEALLARAAVSNSTVSTITPARLWVLSRREFSSLLDRCPAVRAHLEQRCAQPVGAGRPAVQPDGGFGQLLPLGVWPQVEVGAAP